jgi:hypothetical protein
MNHNHHDDHARAPVKQARQKILHPTTRAGDFDDTRPETETRQPAGKAQASEMLSNRQRLELSQASERNKHFLNPIQNFWPTPSA